MERILKILLISITTFFIALWVITAVNSCNDKKARQADTVAQESSDEFIDPFDIDEDIFATDAPLESAAPATDATSAEYDSDLTNYVGTEEVFVEEKPAVRREERKPAAQTTTQAPAKTSTQPASTGSGNRPFMIVAGSYIDRRNAEIMKKRLQDLNFSRAEIVNFDYSQYHTVLAGRYSTESEANELAGRLKNRGIDCYVQRQKR